MTQNELQNLLIEKGIPCSDEQVKLLFDYMDYILQKNEHINLTAIKDRDAFIEKMIYDCALPISLVDFEGKDVLDIGTGGGYPGTVIHTLTNANVTLLDSTKKKLDVIEEFGFKNLKIINDRAEEFSFNNKEKYDIVIARAVASLNILLELSIPLVKVGGYFIAQKAAGYEDEINSCDNAFKKLDCHIVTIKEETLPCGDSRFNILIKKDKTTKKSYPRSYADIKKRPL